MNLFKNKKGAIPVIGLVLIGAGVVVIGALGAFAFAINGISQLACGR